MIFPCAKASVREPDFEAVMRFAYKYMQKNIVNTFNLCSR